MDIIWLLVLITFPVTCGIAWGYFVARAGRGWAWRIGAGIVGSILWAAIGIGIDPLVYPVMQRMLGGGPDWQGVLGVYVVAAIIVISSGLLIVRLFRKLDFSIKQNCTLHNSGSDTPKPLLIGGQLLLEENAPIENKPSLPCCSECKTLYNPDDYSPVASVWRCSQCKNPLPRTLKEE